jgi:NADH-quinone oxidoreductase subunit H
MLPRRFGRFWSVLLVLVTLVASGCRFDELPPDLLTVLDASPHAIDQGDELEVRGQSFPEGARVTVTFRGDFFAAGQAPRRDTEVIAQARRAAPDRVVVPISETLQRELAPGFQHTTFRGEIRVAFAPRRLGTPPVTGTLRDIVLDVRATADGDATARANEELGGRFISFLGLTLEQSGDTGFIVKQVAEKSPAFHAGLQPGDQITELGDVRLLGLEDWVPAPGERSTRIVFRRGRLPEPLVREVAVDAFRTAVPIGLSVVGFILATALLLTLVFIAPLGRGLAWLSRRVVTRVRGQTARPLLPGRFGRVLRAPLVEAADSRSPALRAVQYLLFLGASAVCTVVALGGEIIAREIDLPLLFVCSSTVLLATVWVQGGRSSARWNWRAALRRLAATALLLFAAGLALASAALRVGSLRVDDLARAQGGYPWQWLAFRDPALLLAFVVLVVVTLPTLARSTRPLDLDVEGPARPPERSFASALLLTAEWSHLLAISTLGVLVFLGGYEPPAVSSLAVETTLIGRLSAVITLATKGWLFLTGVLWLRWALPRLAPTDFMGVGLRWLVPLGTLSVALSLAWTQGAKLVPLSAIQDGVAAVTFAVVVLLGVHFVVRTVQGLNQSSNAPGLNPWI